MDPYRRVSLWLDRYPGSLQPRAPLVGEQRADVAIVGAGLTGLWTAYYLQRADPTLRITLVEREIAGFGASGRNGGWCSALFPTSWSRLAAESGRAAALGQRDAMRAAVVEVGRAAAAEGIDCDFTVGGTLAVARNAAQVERGRAEVRSENACGDDDMEWLGADEVARRTGMAGALGGLFTPHCAALDPAKLVRGLADVVVERGAQLCERSAVTSIEPGRVRTGSGTVRADTVIRATEAYSSGLPGLRRSVAPVYSLIVATEPLPERLLDGIGLADRPTFADLGHVICYGQRTADGRIVFGGRGAPYHFGSDMSARRDRDGRVFTRLRRQLIDMFPMLSGVRFTHAWGGAVAVARDWHASVRFDPATGMGSAGGYVGDGVSTTNLAGRTLADLVTGTSSPLTGLPWVGHRSPDWEPEPLRWLGVNAGLTVMRAADALEQRTGRPSSLARAMGRLLGG